MSFSFPKSATCLFAQFCRDLSVKTAAGEACSLRRALKSKDEKTSDTSACFENCVGPLRVEEDRNRKRNCALSDRRNRRICRRIRSGDGIVAPFIVENRDGVCHHATSRSASRQPALQFARQSDGNASERSHRNDDAEAEHGLRAAAE